MIIIFYITRLFSLIRIELTNIETNSLQVIQGDPSLSNGTTRTSIGAPNIPDGSYAGEAGVVPDGILQGSRGGQPLALQHNHYSSIFVLSIYLSLLNL